MCLNPPPLILGQFMRGNYPEWTVGGPYAEEDLFFSTMIGAPERCGREKVGDWVVGLVGLLLQEEAGIKVPKPQSLGVVIAG